MRSRSDLRYETQRDASWSNIFTTSAQPFDRLLNQLDLVNRIDVDGVNSRAYCLVKLFIRLASAVENDLIRPETNTQCFEKFPAAVDLDVDPRIQHDPQDRHV